MLIKKFILGFYITRGKVTYKTANYKTNKEKKTSTSKKKASFSANYAKATQYTRKKGVPTIWHTLVIHAGT